MTLRFETEIWPFEMSPLFAPSRLGVKDSLTRSDAEVSRKDAKALRFGKEIAGLIVNPMNFRYLN